MDWDACVCGDTDGQKRRGEVQTESEVKPGRMCDAVCKAAFSGLVIRQAEATIADVFSNAQLNPTSRSQKSPPFLAQMNNNNCLKQDWLSD